MQLSLFKRSPFWVEVDVYLPDPNDSEFYQQVPLEIDFNWNSKTNAYQINGYFMDGNPVDLDTLSNHNNLESLHDNVSLAIEDFIANWEPDYEHD